MSFRVPLVYQLYSTKIQFQDSKVRVSAGIHHACVKKANPSHFGAGHLDKKHLNKKEPATHHNTVHIEAQHVCGCNTTRHCAVTAPAFATLMLHSLPCGCPTMPHLLVTHTLFWSDSGHQLVYQVQLHQHQQPQPQHTQHRAAGQQHHN